MMIGDVICYLIIGIGILGLIIFIIRLINDSYSADENMDIIEKIQQEFEKSHSENKQKAIAGGAGANPIRTLM